MLAVAVVVARERDTQSVSMGPMVASYPLLKKRAPTSFRLQAEALNPAPAAHWPFQNVGTSLRPRVGVGRRRRLAPPLSHAQSFFFLRPPLTELEQLTFAGEIRAVPSIDFKSLAPEAPLPP